MERTDRFLIALVGGVLLVAVLAFVLARGREQTAYRTDEDRAEAVAFNYLLALQRKDDARAYGYLDPGLPGYPKRLDIFVDDLTDRAYLRDLSTRSFQVLEAETAGDERLTRVTVQETSFVGGGLFQSDQSSDRFELRLRREDGRWLLVDGERCWWDCWDNPEDYCRRDDGPVKAPAQP